MYSSGYSQVAKPSLQAQKKMQYRSKGKSCGYYMRIVFFFSSLIQSLIIVSLVLFLIYGKKQDSVSMSRIQDLEESFSRLSIENVALRHQRKNLTTLLNSTLTEKARNDWDLAKLRYLSNISVLFIQDMEKNLQQCSADLLTCRSSRLFSGQCQTISNCNCGLPVESLRAKLELVESNFTQTTQRMSMEMDQIAKERDSLNLEAIRLRREKSTHDKEVEFCRQKCKDDFAQSLTGISTVTQNFLNKVESLFPAHIAFQLTCTKQREHLEQIRTNCTSLSREVEDRFQRYLNSVGEQVSNIQSENSRLKAENWRLSEDYRWCSMNRTGLIQQHKKNLEKLQQEYDEFKERLLLEKMRHLGQIEVLQNTVKYKTKECEHLTEQLRQLNMSCAPRTGFGGNPGGSILRPGTSQTGLGSYGGGGSSSVSSSFSQGGQFPRPASGLSFGSAGSAYNKPVLTGAGSSSSSTYSAGSSSFTGLGSNKPVSTGAGSSSSSTYSAGSSSFTGLGSNKPVSTGAGSSSSSTYSAGSSSFTGLGSNKPVSTGAGSSSSSTYSAGSSSSIGLGSNKPVSTGAGSSSSSTFSAGSSSSIGLGSNKPVSTGGSSYGSVGSNPSLSLGGTGSNKPALPGRGSSTTGSSSVSTGSIPNFSSGGIGSNKPTTNVKPSGVGPSSPGLSWFGFGSSNSGQSKPGSGTGRGTSGGTGYGGTGSSSGAGRTSGLGGGSVSITQHLQDLHRLINPSGPEEKQDLSKILG